MQARKRFILANEQVLTISTVTVPMSALFVQGKASMPENYGLNRTLEVRRDPLLGVRILGTDKDRNWTAYNDEGYYKGEIGSMLAQVFAELKTNWLYTALIQASLQGPEPAWSKSGWSFVPLALTNILHDAYRAPEGATRDPIAINVTVRTTALRARAECSIIPNIEPQKWLWTRNETSFLKQHNLTGYDTIYYPRDSLSFNNNVTATRFTPQGTIPECFYNVTRSEPSEELYMEFTLGYWTENFGNVSMGEFTAKWIHGTSGFRNVGYAPENPRMVFAVPPEIRALTCVPHFEIADAEVMVDVSNGFVQDFGIIGDPRSDGVAWSDDFRLRESVKPSQFDNASKPGVLESEYGLTTRYRPVTQ